MTYWGTYSDSEFKRKMISLPKRLINDVNTALGKGGLSMYTFSGLISSLLENWLKKKKEKELSKQK